MSKLHENINKLGLSYKREVARLIIIDLVIFAIGFVSSYFQKSYLFIGICLGVIAIFTFYYLTRYSNKIEVQSKENIEEFVNLFSYFRIYIHNGYNVYSSLKEIALFATPSLKELLNILIDDVDEDKSVKPFIKFARNFNEIIIEEMMISIYQMIDDGEQSNYLVQFESIFDKFSELQSEKNLRSKDSSLGMISSAPLIGSCFLIVMITIGIVSVLGDLMNVI